GFSFSRRGLHNRRRFLRCVTFPQWKADHLTNRRLQHRRASLFSPGEHTYRDSLRHRPHPSQFLRGTGAARIYSHAELSILFSSTSLSIHPAFSSAYPFLNQSPGESLQKMGGLLHELHASASSPKKTP